MPSRERVRESERGVRDKHDSAIFGEAAKLLQQQQQQPVNNRQMFFLCLLQQIDDAKLRWWLVCVLFTIMRLCVCVRLFETNHL